MSFHMAIPDFISRVVKDNPSVEEKTLFDSIIDIAKRMKIDGCQLNFMVDRDGYVAAWNHNIFPNVTIYSFNVFTENFMKENIYDHLSQEDFGRISISFKQHDNKDTLVPRTKPSCTCSTKQLMREGCICGAI